MNVIYTLSQSFLLHADIYLDYNIMLNWTCVPSEPNQFILQSAKWNIMERNRNAFWRRELSERLG